MGRTGKTKITIYEDVGTMSPQDGGSETSHMCL